MAYRMIQVGTGGFGWVWCSRILPASIKDGFVQVVAAVDVNPEALKNAQKFLDLNVSQCYTDIRKAFEENQADFCTIVVPPDYHEEVVDLALAHIMHILSEKPIAGTLEASLRIAEKVKKAGVKMGVTMGHRFDRDKATLHHELRSSSHGKLDYIMCHHTVAMRKYGSWGKFRSEIDDVQMIEGGVHYLDLLASLAGSECDTIYSQTWNPSWSEYKGDPQSLTIMTFSNGVRACLEASAANASMLYPWGSEHWRAECELSTLILDYRDLEVFKYGAECTRRGEGQRIPLLDMDRWGHELLVEKFVKWLDGGEPMETNVFDNLQSMALVSAAIKSSRTGLPVKVQELLAETRKLI